MTNQAQSLAHQSLTLLTGNYYFVLGKYLSRVLTIYLDCVSASL